MAITGYFFDGTGADPTDRPYSSSDHASWMYQLQYRGQGVIRGLDNGLALSQPASLTVRTATGVCTIGGRVAINDANIDSVVAGPAIGFNRVDRVVMRVDIGGSRAFSLVVITGTPAANPTPATPPAIVSSTDILLGYMRVTNTSGTYSYSVVDERTYLDGIVLTSGSPYTVASSLTPQFIMVNATTNPFIMNLPSGATVIGSRIRIVNTSSLATGLLKIVPFTGDSIGPMVANTACYLQNVDQSGWAGQKQSIELISTGTNWAIIGGQFNPEPGSVDSAGNQYFLGKYHRLPLGNTTSRSIYSASPPAASSWSSAIPVSGNFGIPTGSKAVRIRVSATLTPAAGGVYELVIGFSDNTSNVPSLLTAHPVIRGYGQSSDTRFSSEIDVPLDSSGNIFLYTISATNVTIGSQNIAIAALGYYAGD